MKSLKSVDKKILLVRTIGNFLIIGSVFGLLYTFWPVITVFTINAVNNLRGEKFEAAPLAAAPTQSFGSLLGKTDTNTKVLVPKDPNFSIIVEKIGADAPIIPNVDAGNPDVYNAALKRGVAHALGTSFPGEKGVTYLFAHSTDTIFNVPRYNAVFYLLGQLQPSDRIVVFFNGRRHDYFVSRTEITDASDVSYLTMKTDQQVLVLQTCYPPGTSWKRLLVVAKPAAEQTATYNRLR